MRDQMLIADPLNTPTAYGDICEAAYEPRSVWMDLFPPLEDLKPRVADARALCPWSMAAELRDFSTPPTRRKSILDAFKTGLNIMRLYQLPAGRILFIEDTASRKITVWVE